jgi:hypothetical protein
MLSYNEISMYNMSLEPKILHPNVPFIILISISNRNVLHNNRERHVPNILSNLWNIIDSNLIKGTATIAYK